VHSEFATLCTVARKNWKKGENIAQVFYILDPKDEKKYIVVPEKQWVVRVNDVEDEEEYNQCDDVPFFVDTRRINMLKQKYLIATWFPTRALMVKKKLVYI
jgi:hypothetical protein